MTVGKTVPELTAATDVQDADLLASYRSPGPLKKLLASELKTYMSGQFADRDGSNLTGGEPAAFRTAIGVAVESVKNLGSGTGGFFNTEITQALNEDRSFRLTAGLYKLDEPVLVSDGVGELIGDGPSNSIIELTTSLDRLFQVKAGAKLVLRNLKILGPRDYASEDLLRAITLGMNADFSGLATDEWDATGVFFDNVEFDGFTTMIQNHRGAGVRFGYVGGTNIGCDDVGSDPDPGAYGIINTGSMTGRHLRVDAGETSLRHGLYNPSTAHDSHVDLLEVTGSIREAFLTKADDGGGARCGFGTMIATDCNSDPSASGAVALWTTEDGLASPGAQDGYFDRIVAIRPTGVIVAATQHLRLRCGQVIASDHTGTWGSANHDLVRFDDCIGLTHPDFIAPENLGVVADGGIEDYTIVGSRLTDCPAVSGGSVKMEGVAGYALRAFGTTTGSVDLVDFNGTRPLVDGSSLTAIMRVSSACVGFSIGRVVADGTYGLAAWFTDTSDKCGIEDFIPLTEPITGMATIANASLLNFVERGKGYRTLTVTADNPNLFGYSEALLSFASPGNLTTWSGLRPEKTITWVAQNGNCTVVHGTGANQIDLIDEKNRTLALRDVLVTYRPSNTARLIEAGPKMIAEAGWTAGTGTANKGAFAAYAGQTVSAAYVQAEAQATDNAAKANGQRILALEQACRLRGIIV
jgi:hypothetical protein